MSNASKSKKTRKAYELRDGNLVVSVSNCCDDTQYCIDVAEWQGQQCIDNDHDCSGMSASASMSEVATYLHAALASAKTRFTANGTISRTASKAAEAGCTALQQAA